MIREGRAKAKNRLESNLKKEIYKKYGSVIAQVRVPVNGSRMTRRENVVEQLKRLGIKNEYEAYLIASRIVEK